MPAERRRHPPRRSALDEAAPVLAALGDETRLGLIARLANGGELSIGELTGRTHITRQAVTKHLRVLEAAGLVRGRRLGRRHVWRFEAARLALARRSLDQISSWWDDKLAALKARVEE
jgi:DNA-binding transcriptional ArsR family regulator